MRFRHADDIWRDYPELVPGVLTAGGLLGSPALERFTRVADERLASRLEGELPEIQAWRRTFSRMGLKPTQYRCASEALLRRYRKEGSLPRIHPLIDLCNAVSVAFAIPIAVFDVERISGDLEVRHATGSELYETFGGETEQPEPGEVVFADSAGYAHARRWTNRQSARSAVREGTTSVLVVAEAMHDSARADVERLLATLEGELEDARTAILTRESPRFEV